MEPNTTLPKPKKVKRYVGYIEWDESLEWSPLVPIFNTFDSTLSSEGSDDITINSEAEFTANKTLVYTSVQSGNSITTKIQSISPSQIILYTIGAWSIGDRVYLEIEVFNNN